MSQHVHSELAPAHIRFSGSFNRRIIFVIFLPFVPIFIFGIIGIKFRRFLPWIVPSDDVHEHYLVYIWVGRVGSVADH